MIVGLAFRDLFGSLRHPRTGRLSYSTSASKTSAAQFFKKLLLTRSHHGVRYRTKSYAVSVLEQPSRGALQSPTAFFVERETVMDSKNSEDEQLVSLGEAVQRKIWPGSERLLWGNTSPRGPIPVVAVGRRRFYKPSDIRAFLESSVIRSSDQVSPQSG